MLYLTGSLNHSPIQTLTGIGFFSYTRQEENSLNSEECRQFISRTSTSTNIKRFYCLIIAKQTKMPHNSLNIEHYGYHLWFHFLVHVNHNLLFSSLRKNKKTIETTCFRNLTFSKELQNLR